MPDYYLVIETPDRADVERSLFSPLSHPKTVTVSLQRLGGEKAKLGSLEGLSPVGEPLSVELLVTSCLFTRKGHGSNFLGRPLVKNDGEVTGLGEAIRIRLPPRTGDNWTHF